MTYLDGISGVGRRIFLVINITRIKIRGASMVTSGADIIHPSNAVNTMAPQQAWVSGDQSITSWVGDAFHTSVAGHR